jgi:hypothetical protein
MKRLPAALATVTATTTTNGYGVNPPSPYLQSWNLTLSREIGANAVTITVRQGSVRPGSLLTFLLTNNLTIYAFEQLVTGGCVNLPETQT